MDNIIHSFVGAAVARQFVAGNASPGERRVATVVAVVASNAPDIDVAYVWITASPLGFLLHHRGHTHTIGGLVLLALAITVGVRLWARAANLPGPSRRHTFILAAVAIALHLLMDAANVFGVPLWYPLSSRWVFGDTAFIFEPWLWLALAVPLARSAHGAPQRLLFLSAPAVATLVAAVSQVIPWSVVAAMVIVAGPYWWVLGGQPARRATAVGLVCTALIFAALSGLSITSRQIVAATQADTSETIVDLVMEPDPGLPWCWGVLAVTMDRERDLLRVERGTISLLPRVWPATSCTSFVAFGMAPRRALGRTVAWTREWASPLAELRALNARNCWAQGWFRFARVPALVGSSLRDLRLENPVHENFTALSIRSEDAGCPANVPSWQPPRKDILEP